MIGGVYEYTRSIQWNPDIFLIRIAGAHLLSFIAILAIVFVVGYDDIIKGILFGGTFVALHELIWTGVFFMAGTPLIGNTPFEVVIIYYAALVVLLSCIILSFIAFFGVQALKLYAKVTVLMVIFDVAWLALGFKASVSLLGQTEYYMNPTVNMIESLGWCIPAAAMIVGYLISRKKPASIDML